VGFTVVFALLPLLRLRAVSPLLALRGETTGLPPAGRDRLWLATWGLIVAGLFGFASVTLGSVKLGAACTGGLLLLFGLLTGGAVLLMRVARRAGLSRWPFVWRQGMCNLYRPHNQTAVLMLALGLGAFLLATLLLLQSVLLDQLRQGRDADGPNLVFFDVQADQAAGVAELLAQHDLPLLQSVPMVTMRLASINGRSIAELRQQEEPRYERWALNREYRSTYRDHLVAGEAITAGQFVPRATLGDEPVPVTIETDLAESLFLKLGDVVEFDVQGLRVATRIAGLREVDWYRMQPNFFFVFPVGVLEDAPQTWVQLTRVPDAAVQATIQREALARYPNLSVLDASLVVATLDALFDRLAFAIRFMSLFSLLTGAIVLLGSVSTSRFQRLRENVLLRTLGGSGRQIVAIAAIEFLLLGTFAALAGAGLAVLASWALTTFWFELSWSLAWGQLAALWAGLCAITVGLGMANSLGVLRRPPLEILRQEVQ
jgi:putative ABC transport system permease protein